MPDFQRQHYQMRDFEPFFKSRVRRKIMETKELAMKKINNYRGSNQIINIYKEISFKIDKYWNDVGFGLSTIEVMGYCVNTNMPTSLTAC
ncbi:CLUMA_CG002341, isoform A [Clunio marinus]|uniref:CLUMA_CG002341, isoform A n=1 Tax=Clunio marinus TaxID=568069 RepID=A0A1J1HKF2_9DIPT|nr:CLUMA_CG002341, isoform A [Clunio marinus]